MKLVIFKTPIKQTFIYPNAFGKANVIFEDENDAIRIRNMSLSELIEMRQKWLIPEGWPTIKHTFAATYAADPEGFYFLEKNDEKIASISVVKYPEIKFAYIGFYLVNKPFRGKGFGKQLITEALNYVKNKDGINSFGLNCVESAVPMYEKYGFKVAMRDEFWKYTPKLSQTQQPVVLNEINAIDDTLLAELIKFDSSILAGAQRKNYLREFIYKPNTITIIAQENGKITGYGIMSERDPAVAEPHKSYKLGPVYASDVNIANKLLEQLITVMKPNENVFIETPGNNPTAAEMVKSLGFERIGSQEKMFKGKMPDFDTKRIFGYGSIVIGG